MIKISDAEVNFLLDFAPEKNNLIISTVSNYNSIHEYEFILSGNVIKQRFSTSQYYEKNRNEYIYFHSNILFFHLD